MLICEFAVDFNFFYRKSANACVKKSVSKSANQNLGSAIFGFANLRTDLRKCLATDMAVHFFYVGKFHKNPFCVVLLVCFGFFRLLFGKKVLDLPVYIVLRKIHFSREGLKFFEILFLVALSYLLQILYILGAVTSRPSFVCIDSEHSCLILCT